MKYLFAIIVHYNFRENGKKNDKYNQIHTDSQHMAITKNVGADTSQKKCEEHFVLAPYILHKPLSCLNNSHKKYVHKELLHDRPLGCDK